MLLTLNRRGECTTINKSSNQCKAVGHQTYMYEVKAICMPKLDKDGFIIDHEQVHIAVQCAVAGRMSSCEQMVMDIVDRVSDRCLQHGTKLKQLYVKLWPKTDSKDKPVAFIECTKDF